MHDDLLDLLDLLVAFVDVEVVLAGHDLDPVRLDAMAAVSRRDDRELQYRNQLTTCILDRLRVIRAYLIHYRSTASVMKW